MRSFYEPLCDDEVMTPAETPIRTMSVFITDDEPKAVLYSANEAPLTSPRRTIGFGR